MNGLQSGLKGGGQDRIDAVGRVTHGAVTEIARDKLHSQHEVREPC